MVLDNKLVLTTILSTTILSTTKGELKMSTFTEHEKEDLDSHAVAWDARIHTPNKSRNGDGTWELKKSIGVPIEVTYAEMLDYCHTAFESIEAVLHQRMKKLSKIFLKGGKDPNNHVLSDLVKEELSMGIEVMMIMYLLSDNRLGEYLGIVCIHAINYMTSREEVNTGFEMQEAEIVQEPTTQGE